MNTRKFPNVQGLIDHAETMADNCRATECLEKIQSGHLMCGSHWQRVPLEIRKEFYRQRVRASKGESDAPTLLATAITAATEHVR